MSSSRRPNLAPRAAAGVELQYAWARAIARARNAAGPESRRRPTGRCGSPCCSGSACSAISTLVLHFAYRTPGHGHLPVIDAIYFTVETVATVGFGDFSFSTQPHLVEAFGIGLIVAGTTLVTTLFALLTNALVSRRIAQSLGQAKIPGMRGHTVMVGLGAVGMQVLDGLLRRGREVVVVERDEANSYVAEVRRRGVPLVLGDATRGTTLEAANLAGAGSVAILTSDDLTNIETGLAVRDRLGERWADVPVVLRVFDRHLGRRLEQSFDFRHVWSTVAIAAPWFVGAALGLDVVFSFYVGSHPFLVARLRIAAGGGLENCSMSDLSAGIRVVAIARAGGDGALEHPPRRDTRLAAGDDAYLAGPYEELLASCGASAPVRFRLTRRPYKGASQRDVVADPPGSRAGDPGRPDLRRLPSADELDVDGFAGGDQLAILGNEGEGREAEHRGEDVRALGAVRRDVPPVVLHLGVAADDRCPADRPRQVGGGDPSHRVLLVAAPLEGVERGDDQHAERRQGRPGVAREREDERAVGGDVEADLAAWLEADARDDLARPQSLEGRTDVVVRPDRDAAARQQDVHAVHRGGELVDRRLTVVADPVAQAYLAARGPDRGAERGTVRVADLAGLELAARLDELVARPDQCDPWAAGDERAGNVDRREHADLRRPEQRSGAQDHRPRADVLAGEADVVADADGLVHRHRAVVRAGQLLADDRVGPGRERSHRWRCGSPCRARRGGHRSARRLATRR